jgi:hypothetical protein
MSFSNILYTQLSLLNVSFTRFTHTIRVCMICIQHVGFLARVLLVRNKLVIMHPFRMITE